MPPYARKQNGGYNASISVQMLIFMPRAELLRHTVVVLSVIMPRAELPRYTVIVLSVRLSVFYKYFSSLAKN